MDELLDCPFCGGEGQYFCFSDEEYSVMCEDCEAESPILKTMDDAREWWNKRITITEG